MKIKLSSIFVDDQAKALKFYTVPLDLLAVGRNTVHIKNADRDKGSMNLFSMELALYR